MPYLHSCTQRISRLTYNPKPLAKTDQTIVILIRKPDESILLVPRSIERLRRLGPSISSRYIVTCQAVEGREDLGLEATRRCWSWGKTKRWSTKAPIRNVTEVLTFPRREFRFVVGLLALYRYWTHDERRSRESG